MVEVFKTSVHEFSTAEKLIGLIGQVYPGLKANFDLGDCDRILRIVSPGESIIPSGIIRILVENGFDAEVLPDTIPEMTPSLQELEAWLQNA